MVSKAFFNHIFVIFLELNMIFNEIRTTHNKNIRRELPRDFIFVNCKLFPYFKIKREAIRNGVNEGIVVSVHVRAHMMSLWFLKPSDQRFSQQVLLSTIDVSRHRSITYILSRNAICLHVMRKLIVFH